MSNHNPILLAQFPRPLSKGNCLDWWMRPDPEVKVNRRRLISRNAKPEREIFVGPTPSEWDIEGYRIGNAIKADDFKCYSKLPVSMFI